MLQDHYGNPLSTQSTTARDLYVIAVDRFLGGEATMIDAFEETVASDPDFALAHSGLARARQVVGDMSGARASMARATDLADLASDAEQSHLALMTRLIAGPPAAVYTDIRQHVAERPRDVMLAQTCTSIYGMIGLSGQPGREAELLAYTTFLMPHYGEDDWWCLSQQAFSLCETGQLDRADTLINRSLEINGRNSHAAHVRAHVSYESGDAESGLRTLEAWLDGYDRRGLMHCHLSWHVALWAMEQGDFDRVWRLAAADIAPGQVNAAPMPVLADAASLLYRAMLAGAEVERAQWQTVSAFAKSAFPKPGVGFADMHAALAHAMAGDHAALDVLITQPAGPAAALIGLVAQAFRAIAHGQWGLAIESLSACVADHARIGGSRAQRDLLDLALAGALVQDGRRDEARRVLALCRPIQAEAPPIEGL